MKLYNSTSALALAIVAVWLVSGCSEEPAEPISIEFENYTAKAGINKYVSTFSAGVADFNEDSRDDLLIGNHGFPPALYLNKGSSFIESNEFLPDEHRKRSDRHGFTLVDLDNDGDTDILYAAGGDDGIGRGSPNNIYQNMLTETGDLSFKVAHLNSEITNPTMRARHFLPIPSASGEKVDFYLTSLHKKRVGSTNLYIENLSTPGDINLQVASNSDLHRALESNGKDLMFDFDRDGLTDFLHMGFDHVQVFRNTGTRYQFIPSPLDGMSLQYNLPPILQRSNARFKSAVTADLNNDGYPDLYLGSSNARERWQSQSDRISYEGNELHFSVENQLTESADYEEISFQTTAEKIEIDFRFHQPQLGKSKSNPSDIFVGRTATNPTSRKSIIDIAEAQGHPGTVDKSGVHIWYDDKSANWHIHWKHPQGKRSRSKGIVWAEGMTELVTYNFQSIPERETADVLLINDRGRNWTTVNVPGLKHNSITSHLTAADMNNDGWVDIVGTRTGDVAEENGTPFLLLNHGRMKFSVHQLPDNAQTSREC